MYLTIESIGKGCYDTVSHATLAEAVDHASRAVMMPLGIKISLRHSAVDLEPLVQEARAEDRAERRCMAQDQEWRSS